MELRKIGTKVETKYSLKDLIAVYEAGVPRGFDPFQVNLIKAILLIENEGKDERDHVSHHDVKRWLKEEK